MNKRHEEILRRLESAGYMRVSELAADLGVSEMTIRRDLEKLKEGGLLTKTYGGAHLIQKSKPEVEDHKYLIESANKKRAIGKAASLLLQPGESVFIDSGDTTRYLASSIDNEIKLSIVTNSLNIARILSNKLNINVIVLGGKLHPQTNSLLGPLAEEAVKKFKYTKAFLGTSGINLSNGLTILNLEEVPIKRTVALNANQVIVLADSSKFNKDALITFLELNQVDTIVTDWEMEKSDYNILEEKGINVIIAQKEDESE